MKIARSELPWRAYFAFTRAITNSCVNVSPLRSKASSSRIWPSPDHSQKMALSSSIYREIHRVVAPCTGVEKRIILQPSAVADARAHADAERRAGVSHRWPQGRKDQFDEAMRGHRLRAQRMALPVEIDHAAA